MRLAVAVHLGTSDVGPVETYNLVSTELRPGIFEAWAYASGDPDVYIPTWLREGAPCGITQFPQHCGVFEPQLDDDPDDPDDILSDTFPMETRRIDDDQHAYDESSVTPRKVGSKRVNQPKRRWSSLEDRSPYRISS